MKHQMGATRLVSGESLVFIERYMDHKAVRGSSSLSPWKLGLFIRGKAFGIETLVKRVQVVVELHCANVPTNSCKSAAILE